MSTDPQAKLVFGILFGARDLGECDTHWRNAEGPTEPQDDGNYRSPAWDKWRTQLGAWEKTPRNVKTTLYGYDGQLLSALVSVPLTISVEWSDTAEVPSDLFSLPTAEHRQAIKDYCELNRLPFEEPKWWLLALYF